MVTDIGKFIIKTVGEHVMFGEYGGGILQYFEGHLQSGIFHDPVSLRIGYWNWEGQLVYAIHIQQKWTICIVL